MMPSIADEARVRLELMVSGQFSTGGAKPCIKPFDHHPGTDPLPKDDDYRSDDCMWLFNTIPAYVKETGDLAFYRKVIAFADKGEGTVLEHLRRAIEFNLHYSGVHGLPAAMRADWNDCLGLGRHGESVFVAFQLRLALLTYADVCTRLKLPEEAAWAKGKLPALDAAIQRHTWDGKWFVRAFREDGGIVGASPNKQGRIFLEPQAWSVISGGATPEQAAAAMESVHELLATEYGLMLCAPGFTQYDSTSAANILGNPGIKENAGVFCHTQGWAVIAECLLGHAERAYEYYRAYMPAAYNTRAEVRQIEPYVHCQSTHSRYSRKFGVSRLPWLSGTAAWSYFAATHHILGIQPDYDGLRIDPCIPAAWPEVSVTRDFRGKRFDITIRNGREGHGVARMEVNGARVEGNLIPEAAFRDENRVVVELR